MVNRNLLTSLVWMTALCITVVSACKREEPTVIPPAVPQAQEVAAPETPKLSAVDRPVDRQTEQPQYEATPKLIARGEGETEKVKYIASVTAERMDPLESVEFLVSKSWSEIRSIAATVKTTYDQHGEFERHFVGEGTSDLLKDDGKLLTKVRISTMMNIKQKSEKVPWILTRQILTRVTDGQYMYTLDERHAGKMATKRFPEHMRVRYLGGRRLFSFIRNLNNLEQLPDESIGDKRAYAFEGELPRAQVTVRQYIDTETGILLKMVVESEAKQSRFVAEFSDFEINVEFPESHFDFTVPEGIEIQDLTIPGAVPEPPTKS